MQNIQIFSLKFFKKTWKNKIYIQFNMNLTFTIQIFFNNENGHD